MVDLMDTGITIDKTPRSSKETGRTESAKVWDASSPQMENKLSENGQTTSG